MDIEPCDLTDIERLYRCFSLRLEQFVRREVKAPGDVIEEACQVAWSRLADPANHVRRGSAPAWLMTTARREAMRLVHAGATHAELDDDPDVSANAGALGPDPDELAEHRRRLAAITLLPRRQQRVLWLHAAGHTYVEIARYTGDTRRTVERQLLRARRSARQLAA